MFGFKAISDSRFTATFDTDLDAKMAAAISALQTHDLVFLHIKAPDICAHDCQPGAKRDFLERLDAAIEALWGANILVALTSDHTTDSNSGFHTADPVPSFIYDPQHAVTGGELNFGETECRTGTLPRLTGEQFVRLVISSMVA